MLEIDDILKEYSIKREEIRTVLKEMPKHDPENLEDMKAFVIEIIKNAKPELAYKLMGYIYVCIAEEAINIHKKLNEIDNVINQIN